MAEGERCFVLVDLGATNIRAVASDEECHFEHRVRRDTQASEGPESVIARIVDAGGQVLQSLSDGGVSAEALGIAAPGPLNGRTGVVLEAPNLPGWIDIPLARRLSAALGLPVRLGNDANLGALGEWRYGAGQGTRDMIYVTLSSGIGGGVICNGQLLEGAVGAAGELGHISIEAEGELCHCGNRGCVEQLASGLNIGRRARERLQAGEPASGGRILEVAGGKLEEVDAEAVARATQAGDALARELYADAGHKIGVLMVDLIHTFNPELIVLGGGLTHAGDLLLKPMHEVVRERAQRPQRESCRFALAQLGDDVVLYGTLAMLLEAPAA